MDKPVLPGSKRERTTRLGMWLVLACASMAFALGAVVLAMTGFGVDVSPAMSFLATVGTVLMAAIGVYGGVTAAYSAADTMRPSGQAKLASMRDPDPPAPKPVELEPTQAPAEPRLLVEE